MDNRSFVFTGIAFLMIIPSIIIASSFVLMRKTGDNAVIEKLYTDRVFYAFINVESNLNSTSQHLVNTYGCSASDIKNYLTTDWRSFIITNYSNSSGVTITIPVDQINVSNDTSDTIMIGNQNTSQAIPVNITLPGIGVWMDTTLGPIEICCGSACDPEVLSVCPTELTTAISACKYDENNEDAGGCGNNIYRVNWTVEVNNSAGPYDPDNVSVTLFNYGNAGSSPPDYTVFLGNMTNASTGNFFINTSCISQGDYVDINASVWSSCDLYNVSVGESGGKYGWRIQTDDDIPDCPT